MTYTPRTRISIISFYLTIPVALALFTYYYVYGNQFIVRNGIGEPLPPYIVWLFWLYIVPGLAIPIHLLSDFQNQRKRYIRDTIWQEAGFVGDLCHLSTLNSTDMDSLTNRIRNDIGHKVERGFIWWAIGMGIFGFFFSWLLVLCSFAFNAD